MSDILNRMFGKNEPSESEEQETKEEQERIEGKIIHLDDGWGFIESREILYTRIFFHWTALVLPLHFNDLKFQDKVEFTPIEIEGKGYRAIKIKLLEKLNND